MISLMPSRLEHLEKTYQGFLKTGISLIEYNQGQLCPTFSADDIGIYVLIPKLAQLLGCSLTETINYFFTTLIILPAFIGILGMFYLYTTLYQRALGAITLILLMSIAGRYNDVYCAYYAPIISLVPWGLYFFEKRSCFSRATYLFSMFAGLIIGFFHYIRAYAGIGVLLFLLCLLVAYNTARQKKLLILLWFLLGASVPSAYFNHIYYSACDFLQEQLNIQITQRHVFWHSVYIGFGFLKPWNVDNIEYCDQCALNKAKTIDANSQIQHIEHYEQIIKQEVINLVKEQYKFVLFTIFAKIGILLFYLLLFAHFGLIAAYSYPKSIPIEIGFWLGILFNGLFPMLALPTIPQYALGFISFAALYGIISFNHMLPLLITKYSSFVAFKRKKTARPS